MLRHEDVEPGRWPEHVAVFGGGRWTRVILGVLCEVLPSSTAITVHSPHNASGIEQWLRTAGLAGRVRAQADPPRWPTRSRAAIVANAAADHVPTAREVLRAGVPLLVEKPLALSAADARMLARDAEISQTPLAPAHVFVFSRSIQNMAEAIAGSGGARSLRIHWADPAVESRYGEAKRYDSSLPVFTDWLPHVVSILGVLLHALPTHWSDLRVDHGGAEVGLQLAAGDIPCHVHLRRNAESRLRLITAETSAGTIQLDFSAEPGELRSPERIRIADGQWTSGPRPLACMLGAFLRWSLLPSPEPRLALAPALASCDLCDQILTPYRALQIAWLAARLPQSIGHEPAIPYALSELLQAHAPLSPELLDRRLALASKRVSGTAVQARLRAAANSPDALAAFTEILH